MRESVRGASPLVLAAVLLASAAASPSTAAEPSGAFVDPRLGPLVRRTVGRAAERLGMPGCSEVLHDFADGRTGLPLAETLASSGRTASSFVATLRFYDADHMTQCRAKTWAWVPMGGDVVFVCKARFEKLVKKDEWLATNVLVHETLHTLGLGEDPPSSEEITAAVIRRCGR